MGTRISRVELIRGPITLRRAFIVLAAVALVWAYAVAITGGFVINAGPVRFSSRGPRNPLLLMTVACLAAWAADRGDGWQQRWAADIAWLRGIAASVVPRGIGRYATPRALAGVIATITVLAGVVSGAHVAGGADPYGYVSQADLWATAQLKPQPLPVDLPPDISSEALVPLGYRLGSDRDSLVPVYAPGLPMVMAAFERVGGRNAVFLVMPMLAGLAVWTTYALGRSIVGELGGFLAALFLATSPAFVLQLHGPPMSDIPAAAWWSTAFLLVWSPRRLAAFAAGLATGAAILTRPNLVPLAIVVGGALLLGLRSRHERALAAQRVLLFAGPSAFACAVVAYLNTYWYGSPLSSGYGTLSGQFFRWGHFWPNVVNYTRWTLDSQGPFSLLALVGFVAGWRVARRSGDPMMWWFGISAAAAVYACYAFYLPLDTWWTLRFLFPAFPILFIFVVAGGFAVNDRLPQRWRTIGVAVLVAGVTAHAMTFGRANGAFNQDGELRYESTGRYINVHLPSRAVFITMLHSGSVRYYSGRLTIRWDFIPPERFDAMVAHLRDRGYAPFLLIDDAEDAPFRSHFSGTPVVTALGDPLVRFPGVSLYRLSDSPSTEAVHPSRHFNDAVRS